MVAVAENESRSISENVKWGQRERVKRGEYNLGNNRILGYDSVEGKLVPNEDAWIIQEIFRRYAEGDLIEEIRQGLADKGVLTSNGTPFSIGGIRYILSNETYHGDKLLQKQAPKNLLTKKPDPKAKYESNYLKNDHVPLVDDETWRGVQARIQKNAEYMQESGNLNGKRHPLYGKLFCANCGALMLRRTYTKKNGERYKAWNCQERQQGRMGNGCKMRIIKEADLIKEICDELGWAKFDEKQFLEVVDRVDVGKDRIECVRKLLLR